jgi:prepilin-type N-terminal cleavage/methylation domain-containing protein
MGAVARPTVSARSAAGFTLIDMIVVVAVFGILAGISVPALRNLTEGYKLGQSIREVERELQSARLKSVTANRPLRVRFDCPAAGQYRTVELIGTPSVPAPEDAAANRGQETTYPSPASDRNPLTRPNHDGPMRRLPTGITFSAARTLEFWPDGTVHQQNGVTVPWPVVPTAGTSITLAKGAVTKRIDVNGVGKITLVR